ncbi:MAG: glutamate racemase [Pasteurellaceae bacterium]|nr:glutamate racemase [Pasteurellaceae bacterium]
MTPTILLYDSGMGGLTIYDAIRQSLPNAHYLYCFDNAYFPYSEKSEAVLIERAEKILQKVADAYLLDLVVVACNTASTVVLPALRAKFSFPIVGTVPAIKPAAAISESKTIGLLATKGTVARPYVADLIAQYASNCIVEKIGTTDLVEIVEQKQKTGEVDMARLQQIIADWQNHPTLDTVILGCTHFPLVKTELQQLLPNVKFFIDPGYGIAKRVQQLLPNYDTSGSAAAQNIIFCTKPFTPWTGFQQLLDRWGFAELRILIW